MVIRRSAALARELGDSCARRPDSGLELGIRGLPLLDERGELLHCLRLLTARVVHLREPFVIVGPAMAYVRHVFGFPG